MTTHTDRIPLPAGATPQMLADMGISRSSIWRALRRGWYTRGYHDGSSAQATERGAVPRYAHPQHEGPGMFASFTNPEGFVRAQVYKTCALFDPCGILERYFEEADLVQDGLLKLWAERHTPGIKNPQAWFACRLRGMVKDWIKKHLRRLEIEDTYDFRIHIREIEERLCGILPLEEPLGED